MSEFREYLREFPKRPVLLEQEAQIVTAMLDGVITKNTAKELYTKVAEHNLQKYNEFLGMTEDQILNIIKS